MLTSELIQNLVGNFDGNVVSRIRKIIIQRCAISIGVLVIALFGPHFRTVFPASNG